VTHEAALAALSQAANWSKSSRSQGQNDCVEVARVPGWVGVRDSKLGASGPMLAYSLDSWAELINAARTGRLDVP
jgi:hypothetical protein